MGATGSREEKRETLLQKEEAKLSSDVEDQANSADERGNQRGCCGRKEPSYQKLDEKDSGKGDEKERATFGRLMALSKIFSREYLSTAL